MSAAPPKNTASNSYKRPPFEPLYVYILILFLAFLTADLLLTAFRDKMLPASASNQRRREFPSPKSAPRSDYAIITKRNIFNADGVIPPVLSSNENQKDEEAPIPSQLPLDLIGTIVHMDGSRSVATLQNRSRNKINSYKVNYEIDGLAKVLEIQRKKIIFRNLNSGRKEFIAIKEDVKINFGLSNKGGAAPVGDVEKEGNNFRLKRSDVLKYTNNLPELLQTARAVPNIVPGSSGQVDGFRILDMEKDSIFGQLGLQKMDIIKEVNGEPVDSPAKGMELYNALKSSARIDVTIERNGRIENFNYTIE